MTGWRGASKSPPDVGELAAIAPILDACSDDLARRRHRRRRRHLVEISQTIVAEIGPRHQARRCSSASIRPARRSRPACLAALPGRCCRARTGQYTEGAAVAAGSGIRSSTGIRPRRVRAARSAEGFGLQDGIIADRSLRGSCAALVRQLGRPAPGAQSPEAHLTEYRRLGADDQLVLDARPVAGAGKGSSPEAFVGRVRQLPQFVIGITARTSPSSSSDQAVDRDDRRTIVLFCRQRDAVTRCASLMRVGWQVMIQMVRFGPAQIPGQAAARSRRWSPVSRRARSPRP